MGQVRDHLWLWCHEAGSHNGQFNLPAPCATTPAAAGKMMGITNAIMVCYGGRPLPPFGPHAQPLRSLARLVWSVIGDTSSARNDAEPDVNAVAELGLEWLRGGRVDGMIFLASNLCGLDVDSVEWTRDWIAEVGGIDI